MAAPTLVDIAKANGSDAVVGLIEEVIAAYPELSGSYMGKQIPNVGAARTIKGTQYKTLVRTAVPRGGFRAANQGVTSGKSTYENRLVETFIFNSRWQCDKAVADAHEDGPSAFIAIEGAGQTLGAVQTLAQQFYYGRDNGGDAQGHPGLIDSVDASMVVDATGSTVGGGSSVWLVKFGPRDVQWVWGENGSLDLSDVRIESVVDENDATKKFTAYVQEILGYPGVQVGSRWSIVRIKNLTAQPGKTLTDALLYDALAKYPAGVLPDAIFMSRRSHNQLRASRTATNSTGVPAPLPTDIEGIPIVTTDGIVDTEAIA